MEHYARIEGSNEFFARRAAYNAARKLSRGNEYKAKQYLEQAEICIRAGGVTDETTARIEGLKKFLKSCKITDSAFHI